MVDIKRFLSHCHRPYVHDLTRVGDANVVEHDIDSVRRHLGAIFTVPVLIDVPDKSIHSSYPRHLFHVRLMFVCLRSVPP